MQSPFPPPTPPYGAGSGGFGFPTPKFTGRTALLFGVLTLLPALFAVFMGEYSFGLPLLAVSAGFSSLPLFLGGGKLLIALLPWGAAAGLSVFLYPQRPWFTVFVLAFLLLGAAISLCARLHFSRTRMTAVCAGVLALLLAGGFLLFLFLRFGGIGSEQFEAFREAFAAEFTEVVQGVNAQYREALAAQGGVSMETILEAIPSDAEVAQTVTLAVEALSGILPGLLGALCCVLAHFASFLFCHFGRYYGEFRFSTPEEGRVSIALPGAVIFFVGALFSVFGGDNLVSASFINLFLLYLPGLALMGLREIFPGRRREPGIRRRGFLLPLLLVLGVLINPLLLPILLAITGASVSIRSAFLAAREGRGKEEK